MVVSITLAFYVTTSRKTYKKNAMFKTLFLAAIVTESRQHVLSVRLVLVRYLLISCL